MTTRRLSIWAFVLATGVVAISAAACGGSSSESPWPVEPIDTDPGPEGEKLQRGNVIATEDLPNNYGKGGGSPEGEDESQGEADDED
jgi:hypothetical protein